ncbi:hypothetical protein LTR37_010421 [Vermiconidia calcicola]|uniref:Uncharacterized protein n=1 Tax=Vermiconidia calcicola TaxID=1690605 RepID=A0ACC3N4V6_9PEZI|nr:hypothetical protein LTR37_010421 [Vermiconidia calcicola]
MEDRERSVDDVRKWDSTFYPESLAESSNKIRLLHIHAGEFAAPIQCSLSTESLATPAELKYDALSYCWGDRPFLSPISLDGKANFLVTANLLAALRRMRYSDATHTVWVDYLCINQADLAERGQQVALMSHIYKNAQVVLCWLGPCGSTLPGHEELEFCDDHQVLDVSEDDTGEYVLQYKSPWLQLHVIRGSADRWWKRVWTLQEYCLAEHVIFLVGPHQYRKEDFRRAIRSYRKSLPAFDGAWQDAAEISMELMDRDTIRQNYLGDREHGERFPRRSALFDALSWTDRAVATDARDKVYGVMSLFITHNSTLRMGADYTKSVEDVFAEAASIIVEDAQELDLIVSDWPKLGQDRYTWLPDFSKRKTHGGLSNAMRYMQPLHLLEQWRQLSLDISTQPLFQREGSNLYVEGFNFDTVVATVKEFGNDAELSVETHLDGCKGSRSQQCLPFEWSMDNPWHQSAMARLLSRVVDDVRAEAERKGKKNPYGLNTDYALERTVCADCFAEHALKSSRWSPMYDTTEQFQHYKNTEEYSKGVDRTLAQQCFFVTAGGYVGLGKQHIETLDEVAIIRGINMPIVWRMAEPDARYRYISEAFIHGIIYGEVNELVRVHALELQQFVIV